MEKQIQHLIRNAESIVKQKSDFDFPSYNQCIGKDKLYGEYYSKAITQVFNLPHLNEDLNYLSLFVRSFVVIDDFILDNGFIINELTHINKEIERVCLELFSKVSINFEKHWIKIKTLSRYAHKNFNNLKPLDSIFFKNYFVMAPLIIDEIHSKPLLKQKFLKFKNFNQSFLFILQLIDDFEDFDKDYFSNFNQNYFNGKLQKKDYLKLSVNKMILLQDIILYSYNSLMKLCESEITNNSVIALFLKSGKNWLKKIYNHYFHQNIEDVSNEISLIDKNKLFDSYLLKDFPENSSETNNDFTIVSVNCFHNINSY